MRHTSLFVCALATLLTTIFAPQAASAEANQAKDLQQPHIEPYQPNYFLFATRGDPIDNTWVKFQVSLKMSMIPSMWETNRYVQPHFLFTHAALWNLYSSESSPIVEHNLSPGVLLELPFLDWDAPAFEELDFAVGVIHQSTGEQGEGSRGWNQAILEVSNSATDDIIIARLRLWAAFIIEELEVADDGTLVQRGNPDIGDHLALFNIGSTPIGATLSADFFLPDRLQVVDERPARLHLEAGYPWFSAAAFFPIGKESNTAVVLHWHHGKYSSLSSYNESRSQFGIGLAISPFRRGRE